MNWLDNIRSMPRLFITSRTMSVSEAPIWKPTLPPSIRSATGALQPFGTRQVAKPRPYFAPTMKPAFFMPGTMTAHCASRNRSRGIERSEVAMISWITVFASARRRASAWPAHAAVTLSAAQARDVMIWLRMILRMAHFLSVFMKNPAAGGLRGGAS